MSLSILIAAGGTGGHMVPAHALSEELRQRGHRVTLLTDARGLRFPGLFEGVDVHILPSATIGGTNPVRWAQALLAIWRGRQEGRAIAHAVQAHAVVGFGGYPSLPGLLAGQSLRLPLVLHEQNAVLGRVNRWLQSQVSAIALSYANTQRLDPGLTLKTHVTGNPVRAAVLAARDDHFHPPAADAPFELLVTGGSQGARILAERVPGAVAALPEKLRRRISVTQQCREADLSAVSRQYQDAHVTADCLPYMPDLPRRMARAHLVIARAGASTMAELMVMGRPALLVPFAAAMDDHQTANARGFADAGAGFVIPEAALTAERLAGHITGFMESPEALDAAAAAARSLGRADAAALLANLVEAEVATAGGRMAA